jgi:hypothetical protein
MPLVELPAVSNVSASLPSVASGSFATLRPVAGSRGLALDHPSERVGLSSGCAPAHRVAITTENEPDQPYSGFNSSPGGPQ